MAKQLVYTSVPQGLWPGTSGYCTVLCTQGLPRALADYLERLSVFRISNQGPSGSIAPTAENYESIKVINPPNFAHLQFAFRGQPTRVLLKTCLAGFDYSNRLRKLSHFLLFDSEEKPAAGPAALATQPGIFLGTWGGKPTMLEQENTLPQVPAALPTPCRTWQSVTGDAGWAGTLAKTVLDGRRTTAYLVVDATYDPLPLLLEATMLLPPARRWEVTFATNYMSLGAGIECQWRCVRKGFPEADEATVATNVLTLDLTRPLGRAPDGPEAEAARAGTLIETATPAIPVKTTDDEIFESAILAGIRQPTGDSLSKGPQTLSAPTLSDFAPKRFPSELTSADSPAPPPVQGTPRGTTLRTSDQISRPPLLVRGDDDDLDDDEIAFRAERRRKLTRWGIYATASVSILGVILTAVLVTASALKPVELVAVPFEGSLDAGQSQQCALTFQHPDKRKNQTLRVTVTEMKCGAHSYKPGSLVPLPSGATVTFAADGSFTVKAGGNAIQNLPRGETLKDDFEFVLQDDQWQRRTQNAPVTITYKGQNHRPVANPVHVSDIKAGETAELNFSATDVDKKDKLFLASIDQIPWQSGLELKCGGYIVANDGKYFYQTRDKFKSLTAEDSKPIEFVYQMKDELGTASDPVRVAFTILGLDDEPEFPDKPLPIRVSLSRPEKITLQKILEGVVDPEKGVPTVAKIAGYSVDLTGEHQIPLGKQGLTSQLRLTREGIDFVASNKLKESFKENTIPVSVTIHSARGKPRDRQLELQIEPLQDPDIEAEKLLEQLENRKFSFLKKLHSVSVLALPKTGEPICECYGGYLKDLRLSVRQVFDAPAGVSLDLKQEQKTEEPSWNLIVNNKNKDVTANTIATIRVAKDKLYFNWDISEKELSTPTAQQCLWAYVLDVGPKRRSETWTYASFQFFPPISIKKTTVTLKDFTAKEDFDINQVLESSLNHLKLFDSNGTSNLKSKLRMSPEKIEGRQRTDEAAGGPVIPAESIPHLALAGNRLLLKCYAKKYEGRFWREENEWASVTLDDFGSRIKSLTQKRGIRSQAQEELLQKYQRFVEKPDSIHFDLSFQLIAESDAGNIVLVVPPHVTDATTDPNGATFLNVRPSPR